MKTVDVCLSDRMMIVILSRSWQRLVLVGVMAMMLTNCTFAAVVVRNARWYFRTPDPAPRRDFPRSDDAELSVLWIGHATCLVQIGDRYILTDPVFTELVGGFSRRLVSASLQPPALPNNLTVVVSHRHFDHLSKDSLRLSASHIQHVVTPVGAGDDGAPSCRKIVTLPKLRAAWLRVTKPRASWSPVSASPHELVSFKPRVSPRSRLRD